MHGAAREDTDHKLARQQKQTFKALKQLDWESMLHKVGELQQVWIKLTFPQHHDMGSAAELLGAADTFITFMDICMSMDTE